MAYTISESDFFSPSPEYDAELDLQLARIRRRGSALAVPGSPINLSIYGVALNSASKDLDVPASR